MNVVSVCIIAVFAAVCSVSLKKYSGEISALLLLSAVVFIALTALPYAEGIITDIKGLSEIANVKGSYIEALIKAVGICFITQITSDICRENGAQSTASQVEMYGKLAILIIACPLYSDIISIVSSFLE